MKISFVWRWYAVGYPAGVEMLPMHVQRVSVPLGILIFSHKTSACPMRTHATLITSSDCVESCDFITIIYFEQIKKQTNLGRFINRIAIIAIINLSKRELSASIIIRARAFVCMQTVAMQESGHTFCNVSNDGRCCSTIYQFDCLKFESEFHRLICLFHSPNGTFARFIVRFFSRAARVNLFRICIW